MSTASTKFRSSAARLIRPPRLSVSDFRGAVRTRVRTIHLTGVAEFGLVTIVVVALLGIRNGLRPWVTADYLNFLQGWFAHLQATGFFGLGDSFANYNVPYLYLLLVGAEVPGMNSLTWVKIIAAVSDVAMTLGVIAILRTFHLPRALQFIAGASVLLLPEVVLNSAAWGQADSTYSAFIVWAVYFGLRDRARTSWALFAVAFTFKLQAAFILPAFVVVHLVRKWNWQGPVFAVGAILLSEVPALIAGRSPISLAEVYLDQASAPASLTMNAPSIYALLPETEHGPLHDAGMCFAVACVALISYAVLRAARVVELRPRTMILFVASLALIAPYTLPLMHERYFYVGNVLVFVYALIERRFLKWAALAQVVAVLAYSPFLFGITPIIPMPGLALVEGLVVLVVVRELLTSTGIAAELFRQPALTIERNSVTSDI